MFCVEHVQAVLFLTEADTKITCVNRLRFWKDVLKSRESFNYVESINDPFEIANQWTWLNSHIRSKRKPFFIKFVSRMTTIASLVTHNDIEIAPDIIRTSYRMY